MAENEISENERFSQELAQLKELIKNRTNGKNIGVFCSVGGEKQYGINTFVSNNDDEILEIVAFDQINRNIDGKTGEGNCFRIIDENSFKEGDINITYSHDGKITDRAIIGKEFEEKQMNYETRMLIQMLNISLQQNILN